MNLPEYFCKTFSELFMVRSTGTRTEIKAKLPVAVEGIGYYTRKDVVYDDIVLLNYKDKYLVGYFLPVVKVFYVVGFIQTPPQ